MQSLDIELNDEEKLEKLSQDYEKPFSPPYDVIENIPNYYPSMDTNVDEHEWYDAGATVSSGADLFKNDKVLKFRPTNQMLIRRGRFNKIRRKLN